MYCESNSDVSSVGEGDGVNVGVGGGVSVGGGGIGVSVGVNVGVTGVGVGGSVGTSVGGSEVAVGTVGNRVGVSVGIEVAAAAIACLVNNSLPELGSSFDPKAVLKIRTANVDRPEKTIRKAATINHVANGGSRHSGQSCVERNS